MPFMQFLKRRIFSKLGMTTRALSHGEYRRYVAHEIERWKGHVKAAGIQPE